MNIPYTPIQCARKMLAFFVITMLAMLLIIMPATVYFASSDTYADTLFPLLVTTLLGSIIILIALFIENKRDSEVKGSKGNQERFYILKKIY